MTGTKEANFSKKFDQKKTCYNCLKFDVCDVYSQIWDVNEEHSFTEYKDLFFAIAPICSYYYNNPGVDEEGETKESI